MHEVAACAIWAVPVCVEALAHFCLVLWMSIEHAHFFYRMSELALFAVAAIASFFVRAAQLRFVKRVVFAAAVGPSDSYRRATISKNNTSKLKTAIYAVSIQSLH